MKRARVCAPRARASSLRSARFEKSSRRKFTTSSRPSNGPNTTRCGRNAKRRFSAGVRASLDKASGDRLLRLLLGFGGVPDLLILLLEAVHAAFGVDQLLPAREERVAVGADFHADVAFVRGAGPKRVAAGAGDADFQVGGMNSGFHGKFQFSTDPKTPHQALQPDAGSSHYWHAGLTIAGDRLMLRVEVTVPQEERSRH